MKFTKMHGCGNDYIFINCFKELVYCPDSLAKKLSDRHYGIGGDGLVLIGYSKIADYRMSMYNRDGTIGEMCGNAIRCVGKYVYDNKMIHKTVITIETLAGIKRLYLKVKEEQVVEVMVDMGKPIFAPQAIPVRSEKNIVIDEPIQVLGEEYRMTCVSMGNPHAVVFVDNIDDIQMEQCGIPFEHHLRFPNRTNVEFVQIVNRENIKMRVWERGTGETLSCGTGACASVVAGILNNKLGNEVVVSSPGGELKVYYEMDKYNVFLSGTAKVVFTGVVNPFTW